MKPPYTRDGTTGFITEKGDWQCTGSMMGRASCIPDDYNGEKLHLRRVPLDSGGYDPGGAYFGQGTPLYCAFGETETEQLYAFVRAASRKEAIAKIATAINNPRFIKP
jgi:hypothetical protein